MTTAREFLSSQNLEVNETNLFLLTKYTDSDIDYQQFPDADVNVENNNDFRDRLEWVATAPLNEISEWKKNYKGETKMTTARELLSSQNIEINETNLFLLVKFTDFQIDYTSFPDADVSDVDDFDDFGDFVREHWDHEAHERVNNIPELQKYEDIIFYDWSNWDEHIEWVATAPIDEIVDWAKNDVGKGDN
jgi:hypothetical protein